jgi:hypothetical protein
VQSLEQILKRREDITEQVSRVEESKVIHLEEDRQKLIRDNLVLIKEVQTLKDNNSKLTENGSLVQYHQEKASKHEEVQKLLEGNLKTLEQRCKLLEGINMQLQQEIDDVTRKENNQNFLNTSHQSHLSKQEMQPQILGLNMGEMQPMNQRSPSFNNTMGSYNSFAAKKGTNHPSSVQSVEGSDAKVPGTIAMNFNNKRGSS